MITLEFPKIAPILRTTAGVKRLTAVVCGWDNADTGRAPEFLGAGAGARSSSKSFGRVFACRFKFSRFQAVEKKRRSSEWRSNVSESREVMNVRQASQYLGISPDTLYRYITEGEIPAFKLGNRWKLRKTILDRWMERKMSQMHAKRR
jgi:excisionase family DNA binding protein